MQNVGELKKFVEAGLARKVTYTELEEVLGSGKRLRATSKLPDGINAVAILEMLRVNDESGSIPEPDPVDPPPASTPAPPSVNGTTTASAAEGASSMRPADVLAAELDVSVDTILLAAGYEGRSPNQDVDVDVVKANLDEAKATLAAVAAASEGTTSVVLEDSALRAALVQNTRPRLRSEDYAIIDWVYMIQERWFTYLAHRWRPTEEELEQLKEVERDGVVVGYTMPSPVYPEKTVFISAQLFSELQVNADQGFPLLDTDRVVLGECARRLSELATVPYVCIRCGGHLDQAMRHKVDLLFEGKLALPKRTRKTATLLTSLGWTDLGSNVKELQFRHLHAECRVLGPLLDALVRDMVAEGVDFSDPSVLNDFVKRARRLAAQALPDVRKTLPRAERDDVVRRLADILDYMQNKEVG